MHFGPAQKMAQRCRIVCIESRTNLQSTSPPPGRPTPTMVPSIGARTWIWLPFLLMRHAVWLISISVADTRHFDRRRDVPIRCVGQLIEADGQCAILCRLYPGVAAMVEAVPGIIESQSNCDCRSRATRRTANICSQCAAIEGVVAGSGDHSARKFVTAAPVRFRQLRKVRFPAQLDGPMRAKIASRSPHRRSDRREIVTTTAKNSDKKTNVTERSNGIHQSPETCVLSPFGAANSGR